MTRIRQSFAPIWVIREVSLVQWIGNLVPVSADIVDIGTGMRWTLFIRCLLAVGKLPPRI